MTAMIHSTYLTRAGLSRFQASLDPCEMTKNTDKASLALEARSVFFFAVMSPSMFGMRKTKGVDFMLNNNGCPWMRAEIDTFRGRDCMHKTGSRASRA